MSREGEQNAKKLADRVEQDGGYEKNMCYYPPIWADPEIYGMTALAPLFLLNVYIFFIFRPHIMREENHNLCCVFLNPFKSPRSP